MSASFPVDFTSLHVKGTAKGTAEDGGSEGSCGAASVAGSVGSGPGDCGMARRIARSLMIVQSAAVLFDGGGSSNASRVISAAWH
jgi:hypothetical protein